MTPAIPVVANVSAQPLTSPASIRLELSSQIVAPVRWHASVEVMAAAGVHDFIEFGPGRVLTGLVRRLLHNASVANVSSSSDVTTAVRTSA
jgi:[acyl-carrier-protein] S-malonyltransferase